MPDADYDVTIDNNQCNGSVVVNRITDTFYTGSNTTYSAVNLQKITNGWTVTVYVLLDPTSPCYPSVSYIQDTPDDDPIGDYGSGKATVAAT